MTKASTPAWGQVTYPKKKLSKNDAWDADLEKSVYDAEFYQADDSDLIAAAPFVRRFMLTELGQWESMCDLGCGTGVWASTLLASGKDVVGVDFSTGATAGHKLGDRFVAGDITQPLKLERAFDVVTCWEVFEHLPAAQQRDLLANIAALNPRILIASCAGFRVHGTDKGQLNPKLEKQKGRHHYTCLSVRDFAELVMGSGFVVDGILTAIWHSVPKLSPHHRKNTLIFTRA